MNRLSFPIWIVTRRHVLVAKPIESDSQPGFVAAFSSSAKAIQYLTTRDFGPELEITMIARPTMPSLLADMAQLGLGGICIDQLPDGSDGARFSIAELMAAFS